MKMKKPFLVKIDNGENKMDGMTVLTTPATDDY